MLCSVGWVLWTFGRDATVTTTVQRPQTATVTTTTTTTVQRPQTATAPQTAPATLLDLARLPAEPRPHCNSNRDRTSTATAPHLGPPQPRMPLRTARHPPSRVGVARAGNWRNRTQLTICKRFRTFTGGLAGSRRGAPTTKACQSVPLTVLSGVCDRLLGGASLPLWSRARGFHPSLSVTDSTEIPTLPLGPTEFTAELNFTSRHP
jgi:hypothetical protein